MHLRRMFKRLQHKWKLNGVQVVLVISTFAIGGSLCGFLGRKLFGLAGIPIQGFWIIAYILVISLLWPISVIVVSIPLGQYRFFTQYLKRVWQKMTGQKVHDESSNPIKLAIFASGSGSNALKILQHFSHHPAIEVALVATNKPTAGVLLHAAQFKAPTLLIEKDRFFNSDAYLPELNAAGIQAIVLAGFIWKIPDQLITAFPNRMVNIHPALLPKYGGKGMYGHHVHEAVLAAGDVQSGITIHLVDGQYDHGKHLFQATCPVLPNDDADTLAARVLALEHANYASVIEAWLLGNPL